MEPTDNHRYSGASVSGDKHQEARDAFEEISRAEDVRFELWPQAWMPYQRQIYQAADFAGHDYSTPDLPTFSFIHPGLRNLPDGSLDEDEKEAQRDRVDDDITVKAGPSAVLPVEPCYGSPQSKHQMPEGTRKTRGAERDELEQNYIDRSRSFDSTDLGDLMAGVNYFPDYTQESSQLRTSSNAMAVSYEPTIVDPADKRDRSVWRAMRGRSRERSPPTSRFKDLGHNTGTLELENESRLPRLRRQRSLEIPFDYRFTPVTSESSNTYWQDSELSGSNKIDDSRIPTHFSLPKLAANESPELSQSPSPREYSDTPADRRALVNLSILNPRNDVCVSSYTESKLSDELLDGRNEETDATAIDEVSSSSEALHHLAESNIANYAYSPLNPSKNEIRLLKLLPDDLFNGTTNRIACSMFITTIEHAPKYEALSYTWGDASKLRQITVDGKLLEITLNLELALQALRTKSSRGNYWIDAVCINQVNEHERSEQVSKMRSIYNTATKVVVWLGNHLLYSESAFALLHDIYEVIDNKRMVETILKDPQNRIPLYSLAKLFSRNYWWRIWVIQEIYFAKDVVVHCGYLSMDWNSMLAVQDVLNTTHSLLVSEISTTQARLRELQPALAFRGPLSLLLDRTLGFNDHSRKPSLFDAILMHRLKHSTDPRDKVYALVGMTSARDDPDFTIDYSRSVRQVYIDTADYILKSSRHLDIICAKTRGGKASDLPSWVPNLGLTGTEYPIPHRHASTHCVYEASKGRQASASISPEIGILTAEGTRLSSIHQISEVSGMTGINHHAQAFDALHAWYIFLLDHRSHCTDLDETFKRLVLGDIGAAEDFTESNTPMMRDFQAFLQSVASQREKPSIEFAAPLGVFSRVTCGQWGQILSQLFYKRRIFITASGDIGLAEETILHGDFVCILFGCSIPVILRKRGEHWVYVSDALVVGYMYGKGIGELEDGKFKVETFEIH